MVKVIIGYIYTSGIGELIDESDSCPITYDVLKSIPLFQPFLKIVS